MWSVRRTIISIGPNWWVKKLIFLKQKLSRLTPPTIRSSYRSYLREPASAVVFIVLIVSFLNIQTSGYVLAQQEFLQINPQQLTQTIEDISSYTKTIDEDQTMINKIAQGEQAGTLHKPEVTETIVSPRSYTVEKGDTVSTIASKFNLTVATLLEANNLNGSDTTKIQVGQQFTIPVENTSTSLAWLDEEAKVRQERERKARERAQAQLKVALASNRRVAGRASSREIAEGGFDGETSDNLIVPIRHNGVSRCKLRYHPATDYRADVGTPVVASATGKVVEITGRWGNGFGTSILIDHGRFQTRYAHLSRVAVGVGDSADQGQIIGYSGNTGFSTGPHLHFAKVVGGREVSSLC